MSCVWYCQTVDALFTCHVFGFFGVFVLC